MQHRFPPLRAYVDRVASRPRIAAWLASETAATVGEADGDGEAPLWQLTAHGLKRFKQTKPKVDAQAKKGTTKLAPKKKSTTTKSTTKKKSA